MAYRYCRGAETSCIRNRKIGKTCLGNGSTIVVNVNAQGKLLGRDTGQITLEVTDSNGGPVRDSPQYVAVTLNVIV